MQTTALATLGLEINSDGALLATTRVEQLTAAGGRAEAQAGRLKGSTQSLTDTYRQQAAALLTIEQAMERETARARAAIGTNDRLADSMRRMRVAAEQSRANAMASMIKAADPFQATAASTAAVAAEKAAINFGRLREGMNGVFNAAVHLAPGMGQLASVIGSMAIGSALTVGVMAGLAAIAFAWQKIGEESRKATERMVTAITRSQDLLRQQRQGEFGNTKEDLGSLWTKALDISAEIRAAEARKAPGNFLGNAEQDLQIKILRERQAKVLTLIQANNIEIGRIEREGNDNRLQEQTAAADKEYAEWQKAFQRRIELMKETEDTLTRIQREGAEQRERNTDLTGFGIVGSKAVRSVTQATTEAASARIGGVRFGPEMFESLKRLGDRSAQQLEDAAKEQKGAAQVLREAALKQIAVSSGLMLMSTLGGRGGQLGANVIGAAMGGFQAGGPWGAAIAGSAALVTGLVSFGRASREAREQLEKTRESLKQALSGHVDAIAAQAKAYEEQIHALYDAEIASLRHLGAVKAANQVEEERNALLAQNTAEMQRLKEIEREAFANDLSARMARAKGMTEEAEAIEFAAKQQQEYQAAVDAGKSRMELFKLAIVQHAEAVARAAEIALEHKRALEDLNVRRAIALGLDDEAADNLRFQIEQQREYEDAVRSGRDALYLATLAETQRAEAMARTITQLQSKIAGFDATIGGLQAFRDQLLLSDTAGLSPTDRLTEANRQYQAVLTSAKGGDAAAAGRLPQAANTFLEALRAVNASGPAFQAGLSQVLADTAAVMKVFEDQRSIAQRQLDELIRIRELQKSWMDAVAASEDIFTRRRVDDSAAVTQNLQATVQVLQVGLSQVVEELRGLRGAVESVESATRNGFEGAAV